MTDPLTITKDVTFWYVIEDALSVTLRQLDRSMDKPFVEQIKAEITEAINHHLEQTK